MSTLVHAPLIAACYLEVKVCGGGGRRYGRDGEPSAEDAGQQGSADLFPADRQHGVLASQGLFHRIYRHRRTAQVRAEPRWPDSVRIAARPRQPISAGNAIELVARPAADRIVLR